VNKKQSILQAATHLFAHKGYKDTSMAELAQATAVAEGTIFYHFKTKEGVFLAILEALKQEVVRQFEAHMAEEEGRSGLELLETAVSTYLFLAGSQDDLFQLLHHRYPYELAAVNPVCRDHLAQIYQCLVDPFERAILRGQRDGSIDGRPARKMALIIFTLVDGLVRFKTHNLYDAGALYNELILSCRRILIPTTSDARNPSC